MPKIVFLWTDVVLYAMVLNDPEQSKEFHDRQEFLNDWIVDRRRTTDDEADENVTVHGSQLWGLLRDRSEGARVARATTQWYLDSMFERRHIFSGKYGLNGDKSMLMIRYTDNYCINSGIGQNLTKVMVCFYLNICFSLVFIEIFHTLFCCLNSA